MKQVIINGAEHEAIYEPTEWQRNGLQQTASGYGSKLVTPYKVNYQGRNRRIYAKCFSNVATLFITLNGQSVTIQ